MPDGHRPVTPEGARLSFRVKMESRPVCQSPGEVRGGGAAL
jgi:hypothetical protein